MLGSFTYLKNRILVNLEGLTQADGGFLVSDGTSWTVESGATARTSLGVGAGDSPTFAGLDLTGITNGNIPYMSASGFADSPLSTDGTDLTSTGNLIVPDAGTIGLGSGKATIQFDDETTDYISFSNCIVGIGTTGPQGILHVKGSPSYGAVKVSPGVDNDGALMAFTIDAAGTDTNDMWVIGQGGWSNPGDFTIGNENNGAGGNVRLLIENGGNVGIGEIAPVTLTEWTHTAPYLTLHNSTEENIDGGRESRIIARGEQDGTEETILGYMEFAHDGAADDEKGLWRILLNDGNDNLTPSITGIKIDSTGDIYAGAAKISDNSGNLQSANGVASFTGAVTSISIVNGIVTAIS